MEGKTKNFNYSLKFNVSGQLLYNKSIINSNEMSLLEWENEKFFIN
jgi:hypothetical protein